MALFFRNIIVGALLLSIVSCQKKDNTPVDLSKVTVTFTSTTSGQVFHKGDTVSLNANVTYISEMLGIGVQIIDTASGSILYTEDYDLHTDHFSINDSWVDTVSGNKTLQVKVSVFVASNTTQPAERSLYFNSQP